MKTFDIGLIFDALDELEVYQNNLILTLISTKDNLKLIPPKGFKLTILKKQKNKTKIKLERK